MVDYLKSIINVLKISTKAFLVIFCLCLMLFCGARYGWKLFGLTMCEDPDALFVDTVYVTDTDVSLIGGTSSSAKSFVGYSYEIKGDSLYIGIKQNLLFGFVNRQGEFSIKIKEDILSVNKVFLSDGKKAKEIWDVNNNGRFLEKIQSVRLYKSVVVTEDIDAEAAVEDAWYAIANEELLSKIKKARFSSAPQLASGSSYLGLAELENGEQLYLAFERIYNYFDIIGKNGHYGY